MIKIKIPEALSDYIETLTYQVNCHQDLIVFMTERGLDKNLTKEYYQKYQEYYMELELSKRELESFLKEQTPIQIYHWNLDFTNHEVIIND